MPGVAPTPDFLAYLPRRDNVIHALARLQVPEHGPRDIAVHILHSLAGGGEKRPDERSHRTAEDDDAETSLQSLFGGRLDLWRCAGMGKNGSIKEDEAGLSVGFGVVEDRLETGVFGGVFGGHDRGWDFGDPLVESEFDAGGIGFEIRAHVVGFVVAGAGHFFLVQITLDVDQTSESMYDGPQICNQAKEGVYCGHGRAIMKRIKFLWAGHKDRSGHWGGAEREG